MPLTYTDIANLALNHLGVSRIEDLDTDTSPSGLALKDTKDVAVEAMLRDFDGWWFARKVATLTKVADDPTSEWGVSYRYPSDAKRILRILSGQKRDHPGSQIAYVLSTDATGGLIYTDETDAEVEYIFLPSSPALFPKDFAMALSYEWARLVAPQIVRENVTLAQEMERLREVWLSRAQASAGIEERLSAEPQNSFKRARA